MKEILGEQINEVLKQEDLEVIKEIKADQKIMKNIKDLNVKSTTKGVHMDFLRRFAVSDDGSRAWGIHITEFPKCRLLMQDFETGDSLAYDYEHQKLALAFMVAEDLNLAISGGNDYKTVLHCLQSGKTLQVLKLGIGSIPCFYRLGSLVAVGGHKQVSFFDLITRKQMEMLPVQVECEVRCMEMNIKESSEENHLPQSILFVGGSKSSKLTEIILPKEIVSKSNSDLLLLF
jgi:hypothetical protein